VKARFSLDMLKPYAEWGRQVATRLLINLGKRQVINEFIQRLVALLERTTPHQLYNAAKRDVDLLKMADASWEQYVTKLINMMRNAKVKPEQVIPVIRQVNLALILTKLGEEAMNSEAAKRNFAFIMNSPTVAGWLERNFIRIREYVIMRIEQEFGLDRNRDVQRV